MTSALVYGVAIAGRSTVRALAQRGYDVVATDDRLTAATRNEVTALGARVIDRGDVATSLHGFDLLVPAPGVPETHRAVAAALEAGLDVASEIELAYRFEQERPDGPRPMLAVTGTDGKTTTTLLACEILRASGRRTVAAGNTDVPLLDAIDMDVDCFVVEATSFRLAWASTFRSAAAVWLNVAEDHLNWHRSMASYVAAKSKIFDLQRPGDVAVGFADDAIVMEHLAHAPGLRRTFAADGADYHVEGGWLVGPGGPIVAVDSMRRALPHDLTNALAASAIVLEAGLASVAAVEPAVRSFTGPPHRLEDLGVHAGIRWFNDSKATTPHAASVALAAFERVVLIAGGLNKGLDLSPMAAQAHHVATVVAIGRDGADIEAVFAPHSRVVAASDMRGAVARAADLATDDDVVLLSPGCASFDWYPDGGYEARGDDFRREVERLGRDRDADRDAETSTVKGAPA
ncbi:MAG: UDP-N-acetylmuramoyl-L-alanine--D-glutamate ligase [Ilumatobacteraceae bacterium]